MIYAALSTVAFAITWAIVLRFFPPVFLTSGKSASNYPWGVFCGRDAPMRAAIVAQEIYELRFKWLCLIFLLPLFRRKMELTSHAIEAVAAEVLYGADLDAYLYNEARSMVGYYPWLKGMSAKEAEASMRTHLPKARKWVEANRRLIERYV